MKNETKSALILSKFLFKAKFPKTDISLKWHQEKWGSPGPIILFNILLQTLTFVKHIDDVTALVNSTEKKF